MIQIQESWMQEDVKIDYVERLISAIYEILKGKLNNYMIVHIGDLLAYLASENTDKDDELWVRAIYTSVRKGRISILSGKRDQFIGNLHPIDHGKNPEDQSMLNSVIQEPDGTIQVFVILRDW